MALGTSMTFPIYLWQDISVTGQAWKHVLEN